jgi:hypothetical protein
MTARSGRRAVAAALARVLPVSAGTRVTVPDGLVADTFRRSLDALLPPGAPAKTLALIGLGLPAIATDIALVPQHPQTGEQWALSGAADVVPLPWDVWAYLAFHHDRRPVPGAGTMPDDAHRDDPLPLIPFGLFRPDWAVFLHTLARRPEVRQPHPARHTQTTSNHYCPDRPVCGTPGPLWSIL